MLKTMKYPKDCLKNERNHLFLFDKAAASKIKPFLLVAVEQYTWLPDIHFYKKPKV